MKRLLLFNLNLYNGGSIYKIRIFINKEEKYFYKMKERYTQSEKTLDIRAKRPLTFYKVTVT